MRLAEQLLLSAEKNEISGINLFLLTFFQWKIKYDNIYQFIRLTAHNNGTVM
jgi:hypothetical protein